MESATLSLILENYLSARILSRVSSDNLSRSCFKYSENLLEIILNKISNYNKLKSINNVIHQTKNKYKSNRLSSIKSAKANAIIGSNISLKLQTSSPSSHTSLGEIASLCKRKDQGLPLTQLCSSF